MITYFLALLPDAAARDATCLTAAALQRELGLRGRPVARDRLHLTLRFLGECSESNQLLEAAVDAVMSDVPLEPLSIELTRSACFPGRPGSSPWVFEPRLSPAALMHLVGRLDNRLAGCPFIHPREHGFRPHVTWLYSEGRIEAPRLVKPILWRPKEIVLVASSGAGEYDVRGGWQLPDEVIDGRAVSAGGR